LALFVKMFTKSGVPDGQKTRTSVWVLRLTARETYDAV